MTAALALSLLLAAIDQIERTTRIRCTPAQVSAMRAEVTLHPDYTVPGVIGLVKRTCR